MCDSRMFSSNNVDTSGFASFTTNKLSERSKCVTSGNVANNDSFKLATVNKLPPKSITLRFTLYLKMLSGKAVNPFLCSTISSNSTLVSKYPVGIVVIPACLEILKYLSAIKAVMSGRDVKRPSFTSPAMLSRSRLTSFASDGGVTKFVSSKFNVIMLMATPLSHVRSSMAVMEAAEQPPIYNPFVRAAKLLM